MRRRLPLANLWAPVLSAATLLVCYLSASATPLEDARLMDHLIAAYSDYLVGYQGNTLIWKDGTRMPFDDGKSDKNFASLLDAPSLKDMFYAPYRVGDAGLSPPVNVDPGRVRYQPFFLKMYGDCRKGETAATITDVVWLPKKWGKPVRVTRVDGVAARLAKVSAELDRLRASFDKYLFPPTGTFNCRVIAGTGRLSAHGSATAIDIATRYAHYWRWDKPDPGGRYVWRNEMPMEIVEIFEKHGFI